jgi:hypothetical protein
LCLAVGGGPLALQPLAWSAMIIQYSQQMSLQAAVAQTFDGDHPCDLCKSIAAAHHSKKKAETQMSAPRPDLFCAQKVIRFCPDETDFKFFLTVVRALERAHSPPTPPPRFLLA